MEHKCTPKQKIPKWNISVFQDKKITSWTLINSLFVCPIQKKSKMECLNITKQKFMSWTLIDSLFVCPSIAEMMIGMMMKVIQTSTICTNMKNIHILKSYIDAILVPDISSMHAYPQKCPYNTKQTHIHMMLHLNV
jgi:hypothetical protein